MHLYASAGSANYSPVTRAVAKGGISYSRQNEDGVDGVEGHSWGHLGCFSRLEAAASRSDGDEGVVIYSRKAGR